MIVFFRSDDGVTMYFARYEILAKNTYKVLCIIIRFRCRVIIGSFKLIMFNVCLLISPQNAQQCEAPNDNTSKIK